MPNQGPGPNRRTSLAGWPYRHVAGTGSAGPVGTLYGLTAIEPHVGNPVLQVSTSAVSVLEEARSAQDLPDSFGVRVFAQADETGQPALALAFSEEPVDGDHVTEQDGTAIYVAPELAEPLADSVLDVEETSEGPQLTLVPQDDTDED